MNLDEIVDEGDNNLSQIDSENSRKIFSLFEEASDKPEAEEIKWAFIGSKKLF